jgi:polysaccharide biosynthesis transport protein
MLPNLPKPDISTGVDAGWQLSMDESQPSADDSSSLPAPGADPGGGSDDLRGCFHTLLRNLPWPSRDAARRITTVGVTSCYRREGVSTIAIQTARTAAGSQNHRVLLVDANLTYPAVHQVLGLSLTPGLAEVVLNEQALIPAVRGTPQRLFVLTAGEGEPVRVYGAADRWSEVLAKLRQNFDLVVFDLPAISEVGSAMYLFGLLDGVILVVEHEQVRREAAQQKRQDLMRANANILGVAFNKRKEHIPAWLYRSL